MIIVTGGSGQAGKACVRDLLEHGYDVTCVDLAPSVDGSVRFSRVDFTDFGHCERRYGHEPVERGATKWALSERSSQARIRLERDPPLYREGAKGPWIRAALQLARKQ